jgi:hypothetical protein
VAVPGERREHAAGATADVEHAQVRAAVERAVEQMHEDPPAADEPEMALLQLDELAVGGLVHGRSARRTGGEDHLVHEVEVDRR